MERVRGRIFGVYRIKCLKLTKWKFVSFVIKLIARGVNEPIEDVRSTAISRNLIENAEYSPRVKIRCQGI